jgi:hypothetical protein
MKTKLSILATTMCALLVIPLTAATVPAAKTNKNIEKSASLPSAWAPETLSGTILTVDPNKNLVVVKTSDGVPFDMDITAKTRIKSGDRTMALKDLTQDVNKQVSVNFVPERRGDVARTIRIGG